MQLYSDVTIFQNDGREKGSLISRCICDDTSIFFLKKKRKKKETGIEGKFWENTCICIMDFGCVLVTSGTFNVFPFIGNVELHYILANNEEVLQ